MGSTFEFDVMRTHVRSIYMRASQQWHNFRRNPVPSVPPRPQLADRAFRSFPPTSSFHANQVEDQEKGWSSQYRSLLSSKLREEIQLSPAAPSMGGSSWAALKGRWTEEVGQVTKARSQFCGVLSASKTDRT